MKQRYCLTGITIILLAVTWMAAQDEVTAVSDTYLLMTGTVLMEDGSPAPPTIQAELICNGQILRQDLLDPDGRFEFELGNETSKGITDTSVTNYGDVRNISRGQDITMAGNRAQGGGLQSPSLGRVQLAGCEIRLPATPGFISNKITLTTRSVFDDPEVGTIVLQRARNVDPAIVTLTTLSAPPEAREAYNMALDEMSKTPPDTAAAIKSLDNAVEVYPDFAVAWNKLGELQTLSKKPDEARKAYEKAIKIDPDYLGPYLGLAKLHLDAGNPKKAVDLTSKAIEKAPDSPQCLYSHGLANYNFKKFDDAKKAFLTIKKNGHDPLFPMTSFFLAMIYTMAGDFKSAAPEFRLYLKNTPEESIPPKLRDWINTKLQEWTASGKIEATS
jgi:tetratricopeptide (TPR) repeat protein